jgi:hypothetical protein
MNKEVNEYLETFGKSLSECERFCFAARAKELQVEAIEKIEALKQQISLMKDMAIKVQDEDSANCCLSLERVASMIQHELKMWVALKIEEPSRAWEELVFAQGCCHDAIVAHEVSAHLASYADKLELLERVLFPPILFSSPGMIILESRCTICGAEYGECEHLKGLPYMGQLCAREITRFEMLEVSLTPQPANKLARLTSITDNGVMRDLLSWRAVPDDPSATVEGIETNA